jgi:alpha-beta hydrolase superfamily lysophospholipase
MKLLFCWLLLRYVSALSSRVNPATMVQRKIFGVERNIEIPDDVFPTAEELETMEGYLGPNSEHGWFDSNYKSAKLHYRKWLPDKKPRAIIVYAHGIQSHIGSAHVFPDGRKINAALRVEAFNKAGFAVYGHDIYGHGFSEGKRWFIPESYKTTNLKDYCKFVNLVANENDDDVPIFLMGESYGSCLSIHLARQFQDMPETGPKNFDSVVLTAAAIDADLPPFPVRFVLQQ